MKRCSAIKPITESFSWIWVTLVEEANLRLIQTQLLSNKLPLIVACD